MEVEPFRHISLLQKILNNALPIKTYCLDACRINQVLVTTLAKHFYNCKMLDMLVFNDK